MKLGGFGFLRDYDAIRASGYDYAELDMPEIAELGDKDFAQFHDHVIETGFFLPTGARILPIKDPYFFVPGCKETELAPYLKGSCARSKLLGTHTILLGNGKARWLIDETSIQKEDIFFRFLRMLCDIAGEQGQQVLIEPLGPKYSNYINTLPEAARVIDAVNMPNLFAMADLRHMVWNKEPYENLIQYRDIVKHIHVDYPLSYPERKYPNVDDDFNYAPFFAQLKGYDGLLTIEADVPADWQQAGRDARKFLETYRQY